MADVLSFSEAAERTGRRTVLALLEETAGHLELIGWKINLYRERLGKDATAQTR